MPTMAGTPSVGAAPVDATALGVFVCDADGVWDRVDDCVMDKALVRVTDWDSDPVVVRVGDRVGDKLRDRLRVAVPVRLVLLDGEPLSEGEPEPDAVVEPELEDELESLTV